MIGAGSSALNVTSAGTSGYVLTSNGASADPTFQAATGGVSSVTGDGTLITNSGSTGAVTLTLGTAIPSGVTGSSLTSLGTIATGVWHGTAVVPTYGGTGLATITAHGVMIGEGTSNVAATAAGTAGNLLQSGGGSADPSWDAAAVVSTGALTLGTNTSAAGSVKLYGGTSGNCTVQVPAVAGTNTNFTLPASNGTNAFVLQTDGSGNTSWVAPSGGGSGTVNSGTSGQMAYYASSTTAVSGNSNANISSGALTLGTASTTAGSVVLEGGTSGSCTISVPAVAGTSTAFALPANDGTNHYALSTDGSGNTSWVDLTVPGGGTGLATITAHGVMLGEGTSAVAATAAGTAGNLLQSGGASADPTWDAAAVVSTGALTLGTNTSAAGTVKLYGGTSGNCTIAVPAVAGTNTNFTLPASNGTNAFVLQTDGSGNTSWVAQSGGTNPMTTQGDVMYENGTPAPARLAAGTAGQLLRTGGASANPAWSTNVFPNTDAAGDLLYATSSNTIGGLAVGSAGQVLSVVSGAPAWATPTATNFSGSGKTSSFSAVVGNIYVLSGSSNITVTLPDATAAAYGNEIKIINNSTGTVTFATTSSQTISGQASSAITSAVRYNAYSFTTDTANWFLE